MHMLGETPKRTADEIIDECAGKDGINNNNNNDDNNNTCHQFITDNSTNIPAGPPKKIPKIAPEYVIVLDDDSDEDPDACVPKPQHHQENNDNKDDNNNNYQPLPNEPLILSPSNVNLYYSASNNTTSATFDAEIFDMQCTAQGNCSTSSAMRQYFISKRSHIKAAKKRI